MAAVARNVNEGDVDRSDEARLARSFAKMESAVEEAASVANEASAEKRIESPRLDTLSFIKRNFVAGGYNYWADIAPGASYSEDYATGERLAKEFVDFIGEYHNVGNACLLGSITMDMEANGATRGHKIGFMNTINKYAMAGGFVSRMTTSTEVSPSTASDPLLETIEGYRRGMREYARLPDFSTREEENAAIASTFQPFSEALKHWKSPATTKQSAIETLKFMIEEDMFNDMAGAPLARAVIAYLETRLSDGVQPLPLQPDRPQERAGIGRYPLVPTGRGSWVSYSKTSLDELLAKFDRAYPDYTDGSREEVIANWKAAVDVVNDVELRRLAQEVKVAWEVERQLSAPDGDGYAFEAAYDVCQSIVKRIQAIQAHTMEGFKAKALAVSWCHSGDEIDFEKETTDLQLAANIINDLLAA